VSIVDWLASLQLAEHYAEIFSEQGFTNVFALARYVRTPADLRAMGVTDSAHQRMLLHALEELCRPRRHDCADDFAAQRGRAEQKRASSSSSSSASACALLQHAGETATNESYAIFKNPGFFV